MSEMNDQFDAETTETILAFWEREHPNNDHVFMAKQWRTLEARLAEAEAEIARLQVFERLHDSALTKDS